mgnify:CR=1 FL=1
MKSPLWKARRKEKGKPFQKRPGPGHFPDYLAAIRPETPLPFRTRPDRNCSRYANPGPSTLAGIFPDHKENPDYPLTYLFHIVYWSIGQENPHKEN